MTGMTRSCEELPFGFQHAQDDRMPRSHGYAVHEQPSHRTNDIRGVIFGSR